MSTYSRILSRITLDSRQFTTELRNIERKANRTAGQLRRVGKELSISVTAPLAAIAALSFKNFAELDSLTKALESIETSAESTKDRLKELRTIAKQPGLTFKEAVKGDVRLRAVGISAKQSARILKEFGNAIARSGGAGKELNTVTVQLGQLAAKGKVFAQDLKPIIEAAPAVASALQKLYGSVDSESIQKTLAAKNFNSVQFVDELLDTLEEAPRVAGGFKNALENSIDSIFIFTSTIGESANTAFDLEGKINNLTLKLELLGLKFANLPIPAQKAIFSVGGIAAVIGPLTYGFGKLLPLIKGFRTSLNALKGLGRVFGPYVIAIALIIKYAKPLYEFSKRMVNYFIDLYDKSSIFSRGVNLLAGTLYAAYKIGEFVFRSLLRAVEIFAQEFVNVAENIGHNLKELLTGGFNFKKVYDPSKSGDLFGAIKEEFNKVDKDIENFSNRMKDLANGGIKELGKAAEKANIVEKLTGGNFGGPNALFTEILDKYKASLEVIRVKALNAGSSFDVLKAKTKALNDAVDQFSEGGIVLTDVQKAMLVQMLKLSTVDPLAKLNTSMAKGVTVSKKYQKETVKLLKDGIIGDKFYQLSKLSAEGFEKIRINVANLGASFDDVAAKESLIKSILSKAAELGIVLTGGQKNILTGGLFDSVFATDKLDKFKNKVEETLDQIQQLGASVSNTIGQIYDNKAARIEITYDKERRAIESSRLSETAKQSAIQKLEAETDKKRRKVQRQQAIAAKSAAIFAATINTAQAVAKVFGQTGIGGIALAPIIAALGAAQIAAIAATPIPALASGGLAYGPTLSLVGDNRNANIDPEVIAPLSKLKKIIGGTQNIVVTGRLSGGDIYLSGQSGEQSFSRIS